MKSQTENDIILILDKLKVYQEKIQTEDQPKWVTRLVKSSNFIRAIIQIDECNNSSLDIKIEKYV